MGERGGGEKLSERRAVNPMYREITTQHPDEPITKDIRIEWGLKQEAVIHIKDEDDALRIIIEEAEELSEEKPALGTAQEEFKIATGYWQKWQRCEEELNRVRAERGELLEACKVLLGVHSHGEDYVQAVMQISAAVEKAEGRE